MNIYEHTPYSLMSPVFIFTRCGWVGLLTTVSVIVLAIVSGIIVAKKPVLGDLIVYGFVRAQFLLCLLWVNLTIIVEHHIEYLCSECDLPSDRYIRMIQPLASGNYENNHRTKFIQRMPFLL